MIYPKWFLAGVEFADLGSNAFHGSVVAVHVLDPVEGLNPSSFQT
jgi:hypothetical protein